ncbi:MAG: acyloxyacyl hydrolase [Gammaproteobacteria bacterium]|nr:acyloxyacyl hydrolase [Gammaproteobacteria bacterium]
MTHQPVALLSINGWITLFVLLIPFPGNANELILTHGGGSQISSSQENRTLGVDFAFYRYERSPRQHLLIGVSYTYMSTDTVENDEIHALSIYPQLSLFPRAEGKFARAFPNWVNPYFFVRALGPSYISANRLGEREQANHFAFQAQIGVGLQLDFGQEREGVLSLSWKHFSNANLFDDNDGFDFPIVLSLGIKL